MQGSAEMGAWRQVHALTCSIMELHGITDYTVYWTLVFRTMTMETTAISSTCTEDVLQTVLYLPG